ncbi:mevalonate kinase [Ascoidea rubescens DSM 1968]|uniref:Mevalonate kinase n=1 Tax=Ascoidea rubescens DSM 1968 TaxID=1344418 RepID=A0A1D2VDV8_9ASCO|nr:mevalonate kinase [Ascoidea rubescens DSM 1968]ODV59831.1 mevalonate kinase [Ascoidea rubescens DSM 1968]
MEKSFVVSAPGKVIIFGEHAAVYGKVCISLSFPAFRNYSIISSVFLSCYSLLIIHIRSLYILPLVFNRNLIIIFHFVLTFFPSPPFSFSALQKPAIAAAVSLRTYLLVSPNGDKDKDFIKLDLPDIDFSHSWKISDLPWSIIPSNNVDNTPVFRPKPTESLIPEVVSKLSEFIYDITNPIHYNSAYAFLYLYLFLLNKSTPACTFTIRSTLPIGAGLGSSASMAVCLAASLSILGTHVSPPTLQYDDFSITNSTDSSFIDSWSFMAEKCIHGNPSGIDNTVACHGGAIMFQRMKSSIPSVKTLIKNFPTLKLLLTNTAHPRKTSDLVSKVASLTNQFPLVSGSILDAIESLTKEAYNLIIRPFFDNDSKNRLRDLFRINHGLLVSLGVSHPSLEKVKLLADKLDLGETKLTGAGGGGCAITLLKDDIDTSKIDSLLNQYQNEGFEAFETTLGGKGVGLMYPSVNPSTNLNDPTVDLSHFTPNGFISIESKINIEKFIGIENNPEWRFW